MKNVKELNIHEDFRGNSTLTIICISIFKFTFERYPLFKNTLNLQLKFLF